MHTLSYTDVKTAADRIHGRVRPVTVTPVDDGSFPGPVWLAQEYMQHTGSFKARGAVNFLLGHLEAGTLPNSGITIASGGNAGLACAWAAQQHGVTATVFLPATAPAAKVGKLRALSAEVRLVDGEYADAAHACVRFAEQTGALASHAYDHPLIAAGAGTLVDEILAQALALDTIVVAVGGGGLLAGVAAAAAEHSLRVVAVEPERCRALSAAIKARELVDVTVDSIAADSLGARRTSQMALDLALHGDVYSVLVPDEAITAARALLWDHRRIAVEHGAATALAGLTSGAYQISGGERVAVVLCGANTDPGDLVQRD